MIETEIDFEALARERVANSVAWLDERARDNNGPTVPLNWRKLIDIDTLRIDHSYRCVLGQIFDSARRPTEDTLFPVSGFEYAGRLFGSEDDDTPHAYPGDRRYVVANPRLGFTVLFGELNDALARLNMWDALQAEWERVLRAEATPDEPGKVTV